MRTRSLGALIASASLLAGVLVAAGPASAATGDLGHSDQSYAGATYPATSDKPQSKLWHVGATWFADMFEATSKTWHIFRLDRSTETWVDTGTVIDTRVNTLGDALWDGTHLYIASHVVAISTDYSANPSTSGNPAYLTRYSYNATTQTFSLDAGFPQTITNQSSESMAIDEDSTGAIWATWTQVSGNATSGYTNAVYVNDGTGNGTTWGTPFVVPVTGATPQQDDISSVVAYGGNKIGVMWSNQLTQSVYFASHADGAAATTWTGGAIPGLSGGYSADDHLNLKSIAADASGRVFAAIKTSADQDPAHTASSPLLLLVEYSPTAGWTKSTISTVGDCNTRPQVMLDTDHSIVHVVSAAPTGTNGCGTTNAQTIYDKTASFTNPVFAAGRGTPIIQSAADTSTTTEYMNNPTTTKQSVTAATGLVVLAGDTANKRYWHADLAVTGGTADTTPPTTPGSLTATAASSTQVRLAWTASTDDVGVTGYRVYRGGTLLTTVSGNTLSYTDTTAAGATTYTYSVSAIDAAGNESPKASATVTTPTTTTTTLTFPATADATVKSAYPTTNYGTVQRLIADASPLTDSLLKFSVTGTSTCTSISTRVKLRVGPDIGDNAVYGGDFSATSSSWTETGVTWNNKPAAGAKVGSIPGSVALNTSYTADVSGAVKGDGTVSLLLTTPSGDGVGYLSREVSTTSYRPQLVVTCTKVG
ncbi:DNRLRE domain-containing protein [Amnibacterium sp. CER49]|uniref:CBM96 family carbohydrate-binding protein n=1 Tax=Amnibacterium sp. CER49 TaxID=3039161 RepID=UPI00244D3D49|nr:DNRLRE domain-containing protein [Amnibacterium sp. CER49]MDH2443027.1 DNRLRE domain-containing protein [Amnibacterium sp. CER49]